MKVVSIGGVHVHHQVRGILLVLTAGLLELPFRPGLAGGDGPTSTPRCPARTLASSSSTDEGSTCVT